MTERNTHPSPSTTSASSPQMRTEPRMASAKAKVTPATSTIARTMKPLHRVDPALIERAARIADERWLNAQVKVTRDNDGAGVSEAIAGVCA